MKVLVLGDGLLGTEIIKQTGWDYISRKKDKFDITVSSFNCLLGYDAIINCIACTDTYSDNKEKHWNINYRSVISLTDYCSLHNIKLIHISSDYVYTNSVENASENDVPVHGRNWYSYTKLLGDSYVQLNEENLVLRGTHKPIPFKHSQAWINQIGNFDYVDVIAKIIIDLVKLKATGLYNIGTELKTMYDLAKQTNYNVNPIIIIDDKIPKNVSIDINKLNNFIK
jgi:hypothetical protein